MLNPDVPLDQLAIAYKNWRETKGGNVDEVLGLMADDVQMRSIAQPQVPHALTEHRSSKDQAREYFEVLSRDWEMIDFPQDKIVADRDTIVWVGRCSWRNRQTGQEIDTPKVDIWTFRDGKAVDFFELYDTLAFARVTGLI